MTAVRNAEEVYRKYLDRFGYDADGDPHTIALFTFSLVQRDFFDWLEHHRKENRGASPDPIEIEQWYASKPESYFEEKYRLALTWYKSFARALLEDDIEEEQKSAVKEYFGLNCHSGSRFWWELLLILSSLSQLEPSLFMYLRIFTRLRM
jgi:hypothetical protein